MNATVKLRLKPLTVPNFVGVEFTPPAKREGLGDYTVPITELDHEALEELAYGFLTDLYKKAGKSCPFYRPTRDMPA